MPDLATKLENFDSKKLVQWVALLIAGATSALVTTFVVFFVAFPSKLPATRDAWGQFGDFFGGTLNPILSFLGLIALVLTLALQSRQLELTKLEVENSQKELEATREELKKSSAAQELTARALSEQTEFAAISARLAALSASLSVLSELIRQSQGVAMNSSQLADYQTWMTRRAMITGEILLITDRLTQK